jgi:radical SAM/Cys-rich protein
LPYFLSEPTDAQRGRGVFDRSLEALRRLNQVGYGRQEGLVLNLVYNPAGAFLPPAQTALEKDFKRELFKRYGIVFNALYVLTNMPVKRFLDYLRRSGNEERYQRKLIEAFNPQTVGNVMCRNLVSVSWTGEIYDCDFNQMLDIPARPSLNLDNFDKTLLQHRTIATGAHCFGCTAGSGSSCSGTIAGA